MLEHLGRFIPDADDVFFFGGLTLVAVGCWMMWKPLAFIVPGAVLVSVALLGGRRE